MAEQAPHRSFVRKEGGRGVPDIEAMDTYRERGTCPFCDILAGTKPDQKVVYASDHWFGFFNINPEPYTELHLVVAAKIMGHEPNFSYDDLPDSAKQEFGLVISDVPQYFSIERCRSVQMRISSDGGRYNAQTVLHPHWHVMVSDGKPIQLENISAPLVDVLEANRELILATFSDAEPELYRKATKRHREWPEALKYLWANISLLRSFMEDKAGEIRPKFSNEADFKAD